MADPNKYPRDVPFVDGMPDGWKAVEKMYMSGKYQGNTYIRFYSKDGRHKHILSVKAAIQKDAEDKGKNPMAAVAEYERLQQEKRDAAAREREQAGILKGEKRESAVTLFRDKFGPLDGSTVQVFPGWETSYEYLPSCQQTHVTYTDTDGRKWKLLKDIEACFGSRMQAGEDLTEFIGTARKQKDTAPGNDARIEAARIGKETGTRVETSRTASKAVALPEDYNDNSSVKVIAISANQPELSQVPQSERETLRTASQNIHSLLTKRGFPPTTSFMAVLGLDPSHYLGEFTHGLYYQMPDTFNGRPCYQKITEAPGRSGCLACRGSYIYWSLERKRWKIGPLNDSKAGYIISEEEQGRPCDIKGMWRTLEAKGQGDAERHKHKDRSRSRD